MSPGWGQILRVGLAAGLLMNVLGWIGNQLLLGPLWKDAIQTVVPLRSRTWVNEIMSLVPDFVYGSTGRLGDQRRPDLPEHDIE